MQPTPGPYDVSWRDGAARIMKGAETLASVALPFGSTEQQQGNAELFGAAWDMREALDVAEDFMRGFEGDETQETIDADLETIRAAKAKADGNRAAAKMPAPAETFPGLANLVADIQDAAAATGHIGPETMRELRAVLSAHGLISPALGLIPPSSGNDEDAAPPVRKFLDLSTGHLTPASRDLLENHCGPSTVYDHPDGYGWLLHVPTLDEEDGTEGEAMQDCPDDLRACIAKARECGCDYILFDADGPDCPGLECYDDEARDETAEASAE